MKVFSVFFFLFFLLLFFGGWGGGGLGVGGGGEVGDGVEVQLLSGTCQKGISFEITHHGWRTIFKASELSRYAVLKKFSSFSCTLDARHSEE